jgi:hypothetical protein
MFEEDPHRDALPPGPSLRDWLLLAINVAFVAMGVVLLPRKFDVGIVTLTFFGFCAIVPITTILRKLRNRRLRPLRAAVVGGVRIRPSRLRTLALGIGLLVLGMTLIAFGHGYPRLMQVVVWIIAACGAVVTVGVMLGKLPVGHLMFTPQGLTMGRRRYTISVSWDDMVMWDSAEFHDNPVLRIWLRPHATIVVEPPALTARATSELASSNAWIGAPIAIMTSSYALDVPVVLVAIERYVRDPASRAELDSSRLLPSQ